MKYDVKETKKLGSKKDVRYKVVSPKHECMDSFVFEIYLLGIQEQDDDIVTPFMDYLISLYSTVSFQRGSYLDYKRNCFTGLSTIEVLFEDKDEALEYAELLNKKSEELLAK